MADEKNTSAASQKLTGGTLDRTGLLEIFRNLYVERATVLLLVSHRTEERSFWFHKGQLLSAASNREAQLVGELLRTFGLADESVLFSAFERALAEPGRGLARALTETGAVPKYVADACVRALAERILYESFQWTAGAFTITNLEKPPDLPVTFDRTNASLILEGLRRLPYSAPFPGPPLDPKAKPVLAQDLLLRYQWVTLTNEEADVLGHVDGHRPASEVSMDLRILARLVAIGLIQLVPPGKQLETRDMESQAILNVEISGAAPPTRLAEQHEAQSKLVANTYRRIDWVTLYEILGVARDAPGEDIQRALQEKARTFHPDHHLKTALSAHREALETLFKKVQLADKTFRTAESRVIYDEGLLQGQSVVTTTNVGATEEVRQQMARANYIRARSLFEQEDYYPAYEMVRQSVEFDPGKADYWILLSRVQRKNPKWVRQAAETMRRASQRLPESVDVWLELAEACAAERNEPERVKALKEVMKIDPGNRRAQSLLAEIASMKPGRGR